MHTKCISWMQCKYIALKTSVCKYVNEITYEVIESVWKTHTHTDTNCGWSLYMLQATDWVLSWSRYGCSQKFAYWACLCIYFLSFSSTVTLIHSANKHMSFWFSSYETSWNHSACVPCGYSLNSFPLLHIKSLDMIWWFSLFC